MSLELKPIPYPDWQAKYNKLMKDPYLSKKYNRQKRIKDKRKYMGSITPELKHCKGKVVLDIGPGPGEYLEIVRDLGHTGIGIDAKISDCEMGNEYIKLSQLMCDRQKLFIRYIGFDTYIKRGCLFAFKDAYGNTEEDIIPDHSVYYINSQGSIEQCLKDYMEGPPHRETKDASQLKWKVEQRTWNIFYKMFQEFDRILEDNGYLVIWGNGSKNNAAYDNFIMETAKKFPAFKLFKKVKKTFHKFKVMR